MSKKQQQSLPGAIARAAVPCTLLVLAPAAYPAEEDPAVAELTRQQSEVEVGAGYVSQDSYKFGEYTGLQREGGFAIGNFDLLGGGDYDSNDTVRWRLRGDDLGLDTRDLEFSYRAQGKIRIDAGYDQFRWNQSDSYQSPYQGLGSTNLSLPGSWIRPVVPQLSGTSLNYRALDPVAGAGSVMNSAGAIVPPTDAQRALLQQIIAADAAPFQHFNIHADRKRGDLGFAYDATPALQFSASLRSEQRKGNTLIGAPTSQIKENSVEIPDVIDTVTNQFNANIDLSRPRYFLHAGYYVSTFTNNVRSISWQDPNDPTQIATLSSAPGNQFHQLNVSGGVSFTPTTRLTADASYGRATQNDILLQDASLPVGLPEMSADAKVITKTGNLKLNVRPLQALGLQARYRYDDRDNQTPVRTFISYDANIVRGAANSPFNDALGLNGLLGSNVNILANRPQSKRLNAADLDADYELGRHKFVGGYEWEKIERSCEQSWYNCVNANESTERTLRLDWHADLLDSLSARLGYAYGERRVHYDPNAWLGLVPMANVIPGAPTVGATTSVYGYLQQTGLSGWGPNLPYPTTPLTGDAAIFSPNNNIVPQSQYGSRDNLADLPGLRRFNLADRNRDKARFSLDYEPTDRTSLQGNFEFDKDDYNNSVYGLLDDTTWSADLDASYAINDRLIASAFFTHEDLRYETRGDGFGSNTNATFIGKAGNTVSQGCFDTVQGKNNNGKIDPCLIWTAQMRDRADTVGLSLLKRGLFKSRLDVSGDLIFTRQRTDTGVQGGSYANNPYALAGAPALPPGTPAILFIPAADLPPVTTRTFQLRLQGRYALTRQSDLRVFYWYERLKNEDWAYQGLQFGTGTEQLPTLEQPWNYAVSVVGAAYSYRF